MESVWRKDVGIPERRALPGDMKAQAVVIGAGMAGILTAYFLRRQGVEAVVVEAGRTAGGQTGNTTAKITSQHGLLYDPMMRQCGRERTRTYALANERAVRAFEDIITEENIRCHFKRLPAYLYTADERRKTELEREARTAASFGFGAEFTEKGLCELPFSTAAAVRFENQAQFNPLEFIRHLAGELSIFERTRVLSVHKNVVCTDKGNITAEHIVFCTHYPIMNIPGFYFLRQHQERSYVLALEGVNELNGMYYGIDKNGLSFRSADGVLLLGGGSHRTGKTGGKNNGCAGYSYLREKSREYYPDARETAYWSAQDCMPHDNIPFIGKYSVYRPYWYVATGFKKWGMTSSMLSAQIITDMICGRKNPYETVFKPQRFLVRASAGKLSIDVGESLLGLTRGLVSRKTAKCPHMGCRLEWNPEESSWECPCHGSRFEGDGTLIDNPAQADKGH